MKNLYTLLYIFFTDSGKRSRTITDKMIIHYIEYKGFYGASRNWLDEVWRKIIGVEPTTFALRMRC